MRERGEGWEGGDIEAFEERPLTDASLSSDESVTAESQDEVRMWKISNFEIFKREATEWSDK